MSNCAISISVKGRPMTDANPREMRAGVRPMRAAGLLSRSAEGAPDWLTDHAIGRRFYVTGINRFLKETGLDATKLFQYRYDAHRIILEETSWPQDIPAAREQWQKDLGKPQISLACQQKPMSFAKAAQLLVTCEIAIKDILTGRHRNLSLPTGVDAPEKIHSMMSILPAVWNINDFTDTLISAIRAHYGDPIPHITKGVNLNSSYIITDLTQGHTVTLETATKVRDFVLSNYPVPGYAIGEVRAKSGQFLGKKSASLHEGVPLD